jgi:hypothetical protein
VSRSTELSSLKKSLVFRRDVGGDAIEYCTSSEENRLGKELCEDVARPESSAFVERVQDEKGEGKEGVFVGLAASFLIEKQEEECLKGPILIGGRGCLQRGQELGTGVSDFLSEACPELADLAGDDA